jgi:DnaA family protein
MNEQLSLAVSLSDTETFESFVVGDNVQLLSHLKTLFDEQDKGESRPWLNFIYGETGVGKSHLMYALCQQAQKNDLNSVYLSFKEKEQYSVEILDGLQHCQLLCLDNVEDLQDSRVWQVGVFDLINRIKEQGTCTLVFAAASNPKNLQFSLADLASRLTWGLSLKLHPLNDEQRCNALVNRALLRGITMPEKVAAYLVNHWQRDMPSLMSTLDKLDALSLQQQRKLTIPFVKSALNL